MKITELRCSACNGTMKVDSGHPDYAVCEYCGTRYLIEWDKTGGSSGREDENPAVRPAPDSSWYTPVVPPERKKNGWEVLGWKWSLTLMLALIVAAGAIYGPAVCRNSQMAHGPETAGEAAGGAADGMTEESLAEAQHPDGILGDFAAQVFGQPAKTVTGEQLSGIKWLELRTTADFQEFGYCLEDPYETPNARLAWVRFPRDTHPDMDLSSLVLFTGIKKLETNRFLSEEELRGLPLEGISGYFDSLEEVAGLVGDPAAVREIGMAGDSLSLRGAEMFPGLKALGLDGSQIEEPKALVSMKELKSLDIDLYEGGMDFSVVGRMPWLEKVTVCSKKLKDFSFIAGMSGLKELNLCDGTFLDLEPLKQCPGLEAFSVEDCDEVKDMSGLSGLTNLKKLTVDLPYGCPEPDLGALKAMEELYLKGFEKTGFLRNMPNLKTMTLDSCRIGEPSDFEGLVNLSELNCTSFGAAERDYSFITRLPAIERVNLRGTKTYEDISGILNLPTLAYLDIGGMECEIDFDRIQENPSLKTLLADHIKLYQNVDARGGNGIYSVTWDDVDLAGNLSFLEKFKGLETLSIRENELTDLEFAASLETLRSIDFSDNYVTDLSPLSGLKMLREVICLENPVSNVEVLSESVTVIK